MNVEKQYLRTLKDVSHKRIYNIPCKDEEEKLLYISYIRTIKFFCKTKEEALDLFEKTKKDRFDLMPDLKEFEAKTKQIIASLY